MTLKYWLAAPIVIAVLLQAPVALSQGLLGDILNVGSGDSDSGALVDVNLGGSSGDLVNADVGGLLGADVDLGGGGGLLDTGVEVDVSLGLGVGGGNGSNGNNGTNGVNGRNGTNGTVFVNNGGGRNGINGISGSSKLRMLAKILENRAWLRFAQRNRICLPTFGVAQMSSWLSARDSNALPRLLNAYSQDIGTLQALLKNCRGAGRGMLGQVDLGRVIGLDQRGDGSLVLFVL